MNKRGLFIVVEGIDNCGKSTQAQMLRKYLQEKGLEVFNTREPGGTDIGEEIRSILLDRKKMLDPKVQTLLFFTSREEFLQKIVKPKLDQGITVISDRFEASTYVYQGYVQGVDEKFIDVLHDQVVEDSDCIPDLYIILDISSEESFKRQANIDNKGQEFIYEKQGLEFMDKVRHGYQKFAESRLTCKVVPIDQRKKSWASWVVLVDAMRDKDLIFRDLVSLVDRVIK